MNADYIRKVSINAFRLIKQKYPSKQNQSKKMEFYEELLKAIAENEDEKGNHLRAKFALK